MNPEKMENEYCGTGNVLYGKTRALVGSLVVSGIVLGGGGVVYSAMELIEESSYIPDSDLEKGIVSLAAGGLLLFTVLKTRGTKTTAK